MSEQQKAEEKIKVRCLAEVFGSWRAPEARRGDVIEMTRADFEKYGSGAFEDIEAVEKAKEEAAKPRIDPWFVEQRRVLAAEREASAKARAINAERQAEWTRKVAEDARRKAK